MARQGMASVVIVLIAALFLVSISLVAYNFASASAEKRDSLRWEHLQAIAYGQETYFDKYDNYTDSLSDLSRHLKYLLPNDPLTGKPYVVFTNEAKDQWCAVAHSETVDVQYFVRDSARLGTTTEVPINLVTCKQNL